MPILSGNLVLILCLLIGSGLIILEAFMPGFGVAGISGVILEVIAVFAAWQEHGIVTALLILLGVLLVVGFAVFFSYRSAMKGRLSKSPLILRDEETTSSGKHPLAGLVGARGVAVTALRPGGTVEINSSRIPASSRGDFLAKGQAVSVTGVEGDHVLVEKV